MTELLARVDAEHLQAHVRTDQPYLGCPVCVAAGVLLCPGCLMPQRGYHLRCLPRRRWIVFVVYIAGLLGAAVAGFWSLAAYPRTSSLVLVTVLFVALRVWPHRFYLMGLIGFTSWRGL